MLQAQAGEDKAGKMEQEVELQVQKAAAEDAQAGRVILRGARLAVSQPAAEVAARSAVSPKAASVDPGSQPPVHKQSHEAKPGKSGLCLPERVSAVAARVQQAEDLQFR